ncbi:MAG: ATP-dependent helicase [Spirochaetes bacterium]|nr:ATP-dependent helicase [Spirochaetota bacterium]MBU1081216.1 ATP-dependent helicase [Spirochaetota bacterium]
MPAKLPDYLSGLNPEQLEAVLHEKGNLLILAGAGSGKTRVITTKIAWLIRERGYAPESILAVTFTNKAAAEMRERACAIEASCARANLRTFHSFGAWFLRRNAAAASLDRDFTIYDDDDSTTLVRAACPEMSRPEAGKLASAIARAKDYGLAPDSQELDRRFGERDFRRRYAEYERRLRATGNVDFGDLISLPVRVLEREPAIRERTHARFRVILVDEYQDSNVAQFELLKALAGPGAYVCVVGDDDQSIYRFRGAEVKNILSFPEVFPDTGIVKLERNYRSYQSILDIASRVVEKNEGRIGKTLKATRKGGEKPVLAVLRDHDEETAYCVRVVDAHVRKGGAFSDVAVLYRTNAQSLAFERAFPAAGVPYRLVGALRFYEREEVKDALALLALASNSRDEVAFRRVANKPSRGIGEASLEAVMEIAFAEGGDLVAAAAAAKAKSAKARSGLASFAALMGRIADRLGPSDESAYDDGADGDGLPLPGAVRRGSQEKADRLSGIVEYAVKESGLLEYHRGQDEVAGTQKVSNLDELVNAASDYPATRAGLTAFLEAVELDRAMSSGEAGQDAVTLITMHNTKGLEFPVVVIAGMEQGLFPREDDADEDLEEQRRLFYVALTRAKDELHITYCRRRLFRGRIMDYEPSRFLAEVPKGMLRPFGGKLDLSAAEAAGKWRAGAPVYHDDHGSGRVVKVAPAGEAGVCVTVRFETGRTLQFFPKFTSKLEIVSD